MDTVQTLAAILRPILTFLLLSATKKSLVFFFKENSRPKQKKKKVDPLLNQAGRIQYPNNHKYVWNTGDWTRDNWLSKCIL